LHLDGDSQAVLQRRGVGLFSLGVGAVCAAGVKLKERASSYRPKALGFDPFYRPPIDHVVDTTVLFETKFARYVRDETDPE